MIKTPTKIDAMPDAIDALRDYADELRSQQIEQHDNWIAQILKHESDIAGDIEALITEKVAANARDIDNLRALISRHSSATELLLDEMKTNREAVAGGKMLPVPKPAREPKKTTLHKPMNQDPDLVVVKTGAHPGGGT